MNFVRLKDKKDKYFENVWTCYELGFPEGERRTLDQQIDIMKRPDYFCEAIIDEGMLVGLAMYWDCGEYIYFEHLCIVEKHRNKGYGSKVFDHVKSRGRIILEVDIPKNAMDIRRIKFYERIGFELNDFERIQPPYKHGDEEVRLYVMSQGKKLTEKEYKEFDDYLKENIYPKL